MITRSILAEKERRAYIENKPEQARLIADIEAYINERQGYIKELEDRIKELEDHINELEEND